MYADLWSSARAHRRSVAVRALHGWAILRRSQLEHLARVWFRRGGAGTGVLCTLSTPHGAACVSYGLAAWILHARY